MSNSNFTTWNDSVKFSDDVDTLLEKQNRNQDTDCERTLPRKAANEKGASASIERVQLKCACVGCISQRWPPLCP